jgi:hypothetical protein
MGSVRVDRPLPAIQAQEGICTKEGRALVAVDKSAAASSAMSL